MSKQYKFVVTGAFNAGKTTFVKTLSEIEPVNSDKNSHINSEKKVKPSTTVALDYGKIRTKDGSVIHLFGTPGQARFDFMREILTEDMHGFIFLVDATDRRSLAQATQLLTTLQKRRKVPYLLAANKADCQGLNPAEIYSALQLVDRPPIVSCVATDKASARAVVERLKTLIDTGAS
jgi:hypothetical protein